MKAISVFAIGTLLCVEGLPAFPGVIPVYEPGEGIPPPPDYPPPTKCKISLNPNNSMVQPLGGAYVHNCETENQRIETGVSTAVLAPLDTAFESTAGVVTVIDITTAQGVLGLTYTLGSLKPNWSGHIKIQNLTSCNSAQDFNGPSLWRYHERPDPWKDSTWKSDLNGGASGFTAVISAETAMSVAGKAVVVYVPYDTYENGLLRPIACGIIGVVARISGDTVLQTASPTPSPTAHATELEPLGVGKTDTGSSGSSGTCLKAWEVGAVVGGCFLVAATCVLACLWMGMQLRRNNKLDEDELADFDDDTVHITDQSAFRASSEFSLSVPSGSSSRLSESNSDVSTGVQVHRYIPVDPSHGLLNRLQPLRTTEGSPGLDSLDMDDQVYI
eukprot:TRINITY_DN3943_c0_g1_i3.p1 TRINITY_DN3943_c0_g1~~TRINITY_DN3943_c0_g1_i3.p1  ORF type:complete len:387 (-),score=59.58 TRINITY_DN3943_c0_g1_i3:66-1226(-)